MLSGLGPERCGSGLLGAQGGAAPACDGNAAASACGPTRLVRAWLWLQAAVAVVWLGCRSVWHHSGCRPVWQCRSSFPILADVLFLYLFGNFCTFSRYCTFLYLKFGLRFAYVLGRGTSTSGHLVFASSNMQNLSVLRSRFYSTLVLAVTTTGTVSTVVMTSRARQTPVNWFIYLPHTT